MSVIETVMVTVVVAETVDPFAVTVFVPCGKWLEQ